MNLRVFGIPIFLSFTLGLAAQTVYPNTGLGQVAVGAPGAAGSLSFAVAGNPSFALRLGAGSDFALGAATCNGTSCTVPVTFTPSRPGFRKDAVIVRDASQNLLGWMQVSGTGLGPVVQLEPLNQAAAALPGQSASVLEGIAIDTNGDTYVADSFNNVVYKIPAGGAAATIVAGQIGAGNTYPAGDGGPATAATLSSPSSLALDAAGDLYIVDQFVAAGQNTPGSSVVRKVDAFTQNISTVAGAGTVNQPVGLAVSPNGALYIADDLDFVVYRLNSPGSVSIVAGTKGTAGTSASTFQSPTSLAFDSAGNLYVSDAAAYLVLEVAAGSSTIATFAGNGTSGYSGDNGPALSASFRTPYGLAIDAAGNMYVADFNGADIRRIDNAGSHTVTTLVASINTPIQLALDSGGILYAAAADSYVHSFSGVTLTPFDSTAVGQTDSATQALTLHNTGNAAMPLSVALANGAASDFTQSNTCGASLASGASCVVTVTFAPQVSPARADALTITDNAAGSPQSVALSGTSTGGTPAVTFAPTSLNFGSQNIGTASGSQTVTLTSSGSAPVVLSADVSLTGSDFALTGNTCTQALQLLVNATCTFSVQFTPAAAGARSGTAVVVGNMAAPGFNLSGQGVFPPTPALVASSSSLTFGNQALGTSSAQTLTLTNTFTSAVALGNISVAPAADFTVTGGTCGSTLAAAQNCTIMVTFAPQATGARAAVLSIVHTDPAASQAATLSVNLSGTGTNAGALTVSGSSIGFGNQSVGTASAAQTVTLSNTFASAVVLGTVSVTSGSDFTVASNSCGSSLAAGQSCSIAVTFTPTATAARAAVLSIAHNDPGATQAATLSVNLSGTGAGGLTFIPVAPCRVADTRNAAGDFGGPSLGKNATRSFTIPGQCGIPANAAAYALNVTVVPAAALGYLSIWPSGQSQPLVSTLNSDGRVKANAAIVPAGTNGAISVFASDKTDVILDINGYFAAPGSTPSYAFYPLAPCRVVDTRNTAGPLGGPYLSGSKARSFPIANLCGLPSGVQAYSLNFTAIPHEPIGYLSTWPTGQGQPLVSTLNASTGAVTANAAIIQAGQSGSIDVFSSHDTDLVIDVNGYFGAPGAGGLALYTVVPCRVEDTRNYGKALNGALAVDAVTSPCATPASAQALVLNATVVPSVDLGFLTLWPDGIGRPLASTLNASDAAVTSNMAIIPTTNGSVDVFSSSATQVILDVSSYFAP